MAGHHWLNLVHRKVRVEYGLLRIMALRGWFYGKASTISGSSGKDRRIIALNNLAARAGWTLSKAAPGYRQNRGMG